jgi:hypothetical protein
MTHIWGAAGAPSQPWPAERAAVVGWARRGAASAPLRCSSSAAAAASASAAAAAAAAAAAVAAVAPGGQRRGQLGHGALRWVGSERQRAASAQLRRHEVGPQVASQLGRGLGGGGGHAHLGARRLGQARRQHLRACVRVSTRLRMAAAPRGGGQACVTSAPNRAHSPPCPVPASAHAGAGASRLLL